MSSSHYGLCRLKNLIHSYQTSLPPPNPEWPQDVQNMVLHIHAHLFDEGLWISSVFETCGIRDKKFSGYFEYYVGDTPKGYIMQHRIAAAKWALQCCKQAKIVHVALAVGFSRPNTFTMAFRKYVGCTPVAYRSTEKIEGSIEGVSEEFAAVDIYSSQASTYKETRPLHPISAPLTHSSERSYEDMYPSILRSSLYSASACSLRKPPAGSHRGKQNANSPTQ
jgi:AraC-like DNA-binding protein